MKLELDQPVVELGTTLGDALSVPTRIYANAVTALQRALGDDLHALCHVTGGGVPGNLPRVLPPGRSPASAATIRVPPIFDLIQRGGPVAEAEMQRTFNLGVGLVAVVAGIEPTGPWRRSSMRESEPGAGVRSRLARRRHPPRVEYR